MIRATGIAAALLATGALVTVFEGRAEAQSPPAAPDKIAYGDWLLEPKIEVRVRGEYRHDPPDFGGLDFFQNDSRRIRDPWGVFERSRLGLGVDRGPVHAQITFQDARALGTPSPNASFANDGLGGFQPWEAYLEVHGSTARPTYFRLGRQAVQWGEGRLIGTADFSHTGRSLDAARAHYAKGDLDFEALAVLLEAPGPLGVSAGDQSGSVRSGVQLYGLTGKWSIAPMLKVELFALARWARSSAALDGSRFALARLSGETYTGSIRVSGESRGWDYGAEGAYQIGTADALGDRDIAAWAAYAHVAKTVDQLAMSPTFKITASYASGDDDSSGKYKQFDPLLADPQRFHGQTDLFGWSNLEDIGAGVKLLPWSDTALNLDYRYARLAEAKGEWINGYQRSIGQAAARPGTLGFTPTNTFVPEAHELGHEVAMTFAWRPVAPFELRLGYSALFMGDAARDIMSAHHRGRIEDDGSVRTSAVTHYAFLQTELKL